MNKNISIITLQGPQIVPFLKHLYSLRIEVLQEFPYLYAGNEDYEIQYSKHFSHSENSILVIARDNHVNKIIGAATAIPLEEADDEVRRPFLQKGYNLEDVFFYRESVILHGFRGKGLGKLFFVEREKAALKQNPKLKYITFWTVERTADHPARPRNYKSLSNLWHKQGFQECSQLRTQFSWPEVDKQNNALNTMVFWIKNLH